MAFLPPQDLKFPCQDYREGQLQKTLAYAQALQYWAEKANLPTLGQPHLLARCVQELRWEMRSYITFMDGAVLEEMTPQQELLGRQTKESSLVETLPTPTLEELMDIQVGEPGVPSISQQDEKGEEMALANKLPTPMPEELMGRLASDLDELANEPDAASDTSEEPTDELADLMATVSKPTGGQTPLYPAGGGRKEGEGAKLQLPQLDKGDTYHMASDLQPDGPL